MIGAGVEATASRAAWRARIPTASRVKYIERNDTQREHNQYNASIAMDMDIKPKPVKLRAAESAESPTSPKTAKALQLNAANVTDPTKHGTTNAQLE